MRIGIDMLAVQSAGRDRGTGRYTRALVTELLQDASHEWLTYYHGGLSAGNSTGGNPSFNREPTASAGVALGGRVERLMNGRFEISALAGAVGGRLNEGIGSGRCEANVIERVLAPQPSLHSSVEEMLRKNADDLDWLLLSCPLENFQGYLPPFPRRAGPKLAAILYDFIPLRFAEHYLGHLGIAAAYRRALAAVRQYDLLLTISESARQDALEFLRIPDERVVTIGAGSDATFFRPPNSPLPDDVATEWLSTHRIAQPYVYSLTAVDYRKNVSGLLTAIERLPARLLDEHQFVITCAVSNDDDARQARDFIERSPVADRLVLTSRLDDVQLRTLYQHAAAFVFPSRYEGFGLPLVEAMQCGTPVIGGNNSSQIEVVGEAGLLVDVDDADALAAKIGQVLTDHQLATHLRQRGVEQARRFAWPAVAGHCLKALDTAAERPRRTAWLASFAARARLSLQSRAPRRTERPGHVWT